MRILSNNPYVKVSIIGLAAIIGLYLVTNPDAFSELFQDKPEVKFFGTPTISENEIPVNFATIVTMTARNLDDQEFSNIEARLSVIDGENWEEHLEFEQIIELEKILEPGETSKTINIPIKAKKISGKETLFTMKLELFTNGEDTDEYVFNLKIK